MQEAEQAFLERRQKQIQANQAREAERQAGREAAALELAQALEPVLELEGVQEGVKVKLDDHSIEVEVTPHGNVTIMDTSAGLTANRAILYDGPMGELNA